MAEQPIAGAKPDELKTTQEAAGDGLMTEMTAAIDRVGKSFADLNERMQRDFKAAGEQIAKLDDKVETVQGRFGERFRALADQHQRGGDYKGPFRDAETAKLAGLVLTAAFLRDRQKAGELLEKAAMGAVGDTGYFLQDEILAGIIRNVPVYGAWEAAVPFAATNSLKFAALKRGTAANFYVVGEGEEPTESDLNPKEVTEQLKEWAGVVFITNSMIEAQAPIALADYIATELAYALAYKQDRNGFMGDGTSTYDRYVGPFKAAGTGQLKVTADSGDNTYAEVCDATTKYLAAVCGLLPDAVNFFNPAFYMHRSIWFRYLGARDSLGKPIANFFGGDERNRMQLWGYPVRTVNVAPTLADTTQNNLCMAVFGCLDRAYVARRQRRALLTSDQVRWLKRQTGIMLTVTQSWVEVDNQGYVQLFTNNA